MSSGGFTKKDLMTTSVSVDLLCVCQHEPLSYFMCPELVVLFCLKVDPDMLQRKGTICPFGHAGLS